MSHHLCHFTVSLKSRMEHQNVRLCVIVCLCIYELACLSVRGRLELKKRRGELEKGEAKYPETDSQRLPLLGLIPSRVSCDDLEL